MVFSKRRKLSRGRFRRVRRGRRGLRARRLSKFVKRTVRRMQEIKYQINAPLNYQTVDGVAGLVASLTPSIAIGADKFQRIGNSIKYKFCQFRASVVLSDGTSGANPRHATIRCILIQLRVVPSTGIVAAGPRAGSIGPPVASEIFESSANNDACLVSSVNQSFCRVIMDRTYTMSIDTGAYAASQSLPQTIYIKKKWRQSNNVTYKLSTQNFPTDPKDNFYFVIVSNAIAANDLNIDYLYAFKQSFYDI